jgi:hypothetical protein
VQSERSALRAKLSDYFAQPLSPLIERGALWFELRQFASAQYCGGRLDVAARDALAAAVAVIEAKRNGRFLYPWTRIS